MVEKEAAEGMGSGTVSFVAFVPPKDALVADTRPETRDPIKMPTTNVKLMKKAVKSFR